MRALCWQYFLIYGIQGALLPYLAVLYRERGFDSNQIGQLFAASSAAVIISPVILTALADAAIDPRRIVRVALTLSIVFLLLMSQAQAFWYTLVLWSAQSLIILPLLPVLDGLNFAIQQRRREAGLSPAPYHRVRVWGTIGFIIPGLILFGLMKMGLSTAGVLIGGAVMSLLGMINTWTLPDPRAADDPAQPAKGRGLPTLGALRAMTQKHVLGFCAAMFLAHMGMAAMYTFYPLYMTEALGVGKAWLGPIMNIGVFVEIFCMLGFGWLSNRLGLRGLVMLAMGAAAVRLVLLWVFPNVWVGVLSQVFHGLTVLAVHVVPAVFLNMHAQEQYRHSMQGLYAMLIMGVARVSGSWLSGMVAEVDVVRLMGLAGLMCALATALLWATFRIPPAPRTEEPPASAPPVGEAA